MTQNLSISPLELRDKAQRSAGRLPPLLVRADQLASTVMSGQHGRRRAGAGDEFWQYRQAQPGDPVSAIDWRRSARSDDSFIRQTELSAAQAVGLWVDHAMCMDYAGAVGAETKATRAALLGMAVSILLIRAGERVGHLGRFLPASAGRLQLDRLAALLSQDVKGADYGVPPVADNQAYGHRVYISDFLGSEDDVLRALAHAARRGERGSLVQVLDVSEETFPFDGRTEFLSPGGGMRFETERARALRAGYQSKLAQRRAQLNDFARSSGWTFHVHRVQDPPRKALVWLHAAVSGGH